jgi:penicillin V acylase-like amidase (Ntn superfamily)
MIRSYLSIAPTWNFSAISNQPFDSSCFFGQEYAKMLVNYRRISLILGTALILSALFSSPLALSCTRIVKAAPGQDTLVGRNMDWFSDLQTNLWVYPQGLTHDGGATVNSLSWTAKYGSVVATAYENAITTDGMNEKGLAAHMLSLAGSNYGKRDETLPGLSVMLWAQYYLDNFQTVAEAVRFTEANTFQILPAMDAHTGRYINLHLALEDATGDSAIIEYTNGSPSIYHSRDYTVLTNSPTYDKQLLNLKQYQGFDGEKRLPGTTDSLDRFVRATYYTAHLPAPISMRDAVAGVMSVMQNVAEPYGIASHERPEITPTVWRVVADLTKRVYYFNAIAGFNTIWIRLDEFKLQPGAAVMKLDLENNLDLAGDVSGKFVVVS